jgi:biotin carboxylase
MVAQRKHNVFVVGYDDFNIRTLTETPIGAETNFLPALTYEQLKSSENVPALRLLDQAIATIESTKVDPDAIITYWDFPGTILVAILAGRFGLPGPPVKSLFKCENKLWSRNEQRKVAVDHVPLFTGFDPQDRDAFSKINLVPPFWIKPVKSFRSYLAFRVDSHADFERHCAAIRERIDGIYHPFQDLMRRSRIPDLIANSEHSCIAESVLAGHMCTVEGYVYDDEVTCYGIVDSICETVSSSINRYQYPSVLPTEIQYRMMDITRRVIEQVGLNDTCFNIEYFYNQTEETIYLLEINPRTSQSHADLFTKVHGCSQFQVILELALGRRPRPLRRDGAYAVAAKYMLRTFENGVVKRAPTPEDIAKAIERFPATRIKTHVETGTRLDDLMFQDAYSFELADIYIGASNGLELDSRYEEIVLLLGYEIEAKDGLRGGSLTSSPRLRS